MTNLMMLEDNLSGDCCNGNGSGAPDFGGGYENRSASPVNIYQYQNFAPQDNSQRYSYDRSGRYVSTSNSTDSVNFPGAPMPQRQIPVQPAPAAFEQPAVVPVQAVPQYQPPAKKWPRYAKKWPRYAEFV